MKKRTSDFPLPNPNAHYPTSNNQTLSPTFQKNPEPQPNHHQKRQKSFDEKVETCTGSSHSKNI